MSEKNEKQTSELSMDELDAVAGGQTSAVNISRSNVKNNDQVGPVGPTGPVEPAGPTTPGQ
jgi:hypothetical protein